MQEQVRAPGESGQAPSVPRLDLIACNGCGRRFATADGPGMLAAIKGSCPTCGGQFKLSELDD